MTSRKFACLLMKIKIGENCYLITEKKNRRNFKISVGKTKIGLRDGQRCSIDVSYIIGPGSMTLLYVT